MGKLTLALCLPPVIHQQLVRTQRQRVIELLVRTQLRHKRPRLDPVPHHQGLRRRGCGDDNVRTLHRFLVIFHSAGCYAQFAGLHHQAISGSGPHVHRPDLLQVENDVKRSQARAGLHPTADKGDDAGIGPGQIARRHRGCGTGAHGSDVPRLHNRHQYACMRIEQHHAAHDIG